MLLGTRSSRPLLALVVALTVAAGGVLGLHMASGAAAKAPSYAYIGASRQGDAVYVVGLVKQGSANGVVRSPGRTVYLQRKVGASWQNLLSRVLNQQGEVRVGFFWGPAATYRWVVLGSAGASYVGSATASVGAVTARAGGKPGLSNTGVPAGTPLRVVGSLTLSTPGQVVSGLDVHGNLRVTAKNVVIKNSVIRGEQACTYAALIVTAGASAVVQDSEISVQYRNPCRDAVSVNHTTLLRTNIHGGVDGVKAFDDVIIQASYIHDLARFASDPAQNGGPTHNDAVQTYEGNRNITMIGNTVVLTSADNAALQVTQDGGGRATNIRVTNNWLDGGGCTLNFSHKGGPTPMTGMYVTGNRFGRHSQCGCPVLISTRTVLSAFSNNQWDDNSQPIPAPQQHD